MSCRVLKREMEFAMFDALVEQCQARGIRKIVGVYIPSKKNSMVAGHYASLGFSPMGGASEGGELWCYDVPSTYSPRTRYIRRTAEALLAAASAESTSVPSEI
jgi:predicted enzyme involved in methoxymalonyl-ACP biosynthesis